MRSRMNASRAGVVVGIAILAVSAIIAVPTTNAQTYTVLHTFSGAGDGYGPYGRLTMDRAGNLYGVNGGGFQNCRNGFLPCGMSFRLSRKGTGWILTPLYMFTGGDDGAYPWAMTIGPDGALYGATLRGGQGCQGIVHPVFGCGVVFRLRPPSRPCLTALCPWVETVLYRFQDNNSDGVYPSGEVTFDNAGNIYGSTYYGGGTGCNGGGCGTVYKLTPSGSGWMETIIYRFTSGSDGYFPSGRLIFDSAGNIYGTSSYGGGIGCGGGGCGTVYKLTPSDSGWIESTIYSFTGGNDGSGPGGGLSLDAAGNLYGFTSQGGSGGGGTLFELLPSGGNWTFNVIYAFNAGAEPMDSPAIDPAGNLYGPSPYTFPYGSVFQLTPALGQWIYTDLHDFTSTDGAYPIGGLTLDPQGNLYGTTYAGGGAGCDGYGCGVVWEITP